MSVNLILSTDEVIGSLVGQLSELSGNIPRFQNADESLVSSVHRINPDVVLMDARFSTSTLDGVLLAAKQIDAAVVLFGGSFSAIELKNAASRRGLPCLPLPNGPKVFNMLVQQAIDERNVERKKSSGEDPCSHVA